MSVHNTPLCHTCKYSSSHLGKRFSLQCLNSKPYPPQGHCNHLLQYQKVIDIGVQCIAFNLSLDPILLIPNVAGRQKKFTNSHSLLNSMKGLFNDLDVDELGMCYHSN